MQLRLLHGTTAQLVTHGQEVACLLSHTLVWLDNLIRTAHIHGCDPAALSVFAERLLTHLRVVACEPLQQKGCCILHKGITLPQQAFQFRKFLLV